ncbi:MAG TPA: AmmeMemoRadiSam system protein B [Armatimonadota bacterium]|nr:AmmeMemoRadiSam system protein B [Armatimonadota bacterium]
MAGTEGTIRQPAVAGTFYPRDPALLRAQIDEAYRSPLGPGAVPAVNPQGPRRLLGLVAPHAGYPYSAQGAAWGYAAVARDGRPGAAVLLGVNHRGYGAAIALSPDAGWQTPLGIAPVAAALGERLRALDADVVPDARAHLAEHSLEVQLPFLQHLFGAVPILPILIGRAGLDAVLRLGKTLAALARDQELLLIASTDLSHYVPQAVAQRQDQLALQAIAAVQPLQLIDTVRRHEIGMCGVLPVTAVLAAAQVLGATARIVHYHTSGDVTGETDAVVGYGTAVLDRAPSPGPPVCTVPAKE